MSGPPFMSDDIGASGLLETIEFFKALFIFSIQYTKLLCSMLYSFLLLMHHKPVNIAWSCVLLDVEQFLVFVHRNFE